MYRVQKKRRGGLFFSLLFLCAFVIGLGIGYGGIKMNLWKNGADAMPGRTQTEPPLYADRETPEPNRAASLSTVVPAETEPPRQMYFVAAQDGVVCVFTIDENGDKRFSHKIPIELGALRQEDQNLFKEGIYLYSKQEMLELMEDFGS